MRDYRYHVPPGTPYRKGATPEAVENAAKRGFWAIDLDIRKTADGIEVVAHWDDITVEGWRTPGITSGRITKMTWVQVRNLRSADGDRIYTLAEMLRSCAIFGVVGCLEAKRSDPRWKMVQSWTRIARIARSEGAVIQATAVKKLWGRRAARQIQNAARRAGIPNWHKPSVRPTPRKEAMAKKVSRINKVYSDLWDIINDAEDKGKTGYAKRLRTIAGMFNILKVRD